MLAYKAPVCQKTSEAPMSDDDALPSTATVAPPVNNCVQPAGSLQNRHCERRRRRSVVVVQRVSDVALPGKKGIY